MLPEDYKIRCDKHQFKPYEYCEMCWLRNEIQNAVENARKDSRALVANTHLCISELQDLFNKLKNEIDYIKGHLVI